MNSDEGVRIREDEQCHDVTLDRLRKLLNRHQQRSRVAPGVVSTGFERLDEALPGGGLPSGSVIEVLSGGSGTGAWTLALRIAGCRLGIADFGCTQSATRDVVVVDCDGDFYPPAAMAMGFSADRLLVVRVRKSADAFWATDQALRCRAVGAVIATRLVLDAAGSRRLQLAAEASGGVGLVLAPASSRSHTFAAVQLLVEPVSWGHYESQSGVAWPRLRGHENVRSRRADAKHAHASGGMPPGVARRFRITVLKMRGRKPVEPVIVGLSDESFDVPLSSVPTDRTASDRARRSA